LDSVEACTAEPPSAQRLELDPSATDPTGAPLPRLNF
jgi:hypothetical protein